MKTFISLSLFLITPFLFANEFKACDSFNHNQILRFHKTQVQVVKFSQEKCLFSLTNTHHIGMIYRSFLFNNLGDLIVFNSFGPGSPSTDTGARSFTMLPKTKTLSLSFDEENLNLLIQTTSGRVFTFDSEKTKVLAISGADFIESDEVRGDNNGGLEIIPTSGLILDEGWRTGGLPRINLNRKSIFKDGIGGQCLVKNEEIFKYYFDQSGRVDGALFIYSNPIELKRFIKNRCPELNY